MRQQAIQLERFQHSGGWEEGTQSPLEGPLAPYLAAMAEQQSAQPAIYDINGAMLTYGALYEQLTTTVAHLQQLGIGRNDRVALVLPNGPAMAMAFLSVAACATCAPLNPTYRSAEFAFYLADLDAKAVIVAEAVDSPVRAIAMELKIPLIELTADATTAGLFTLTGNGAEIISPGFAQEEDIALILHTSGTTARPKMVPLTQRNLLRSAATIAATLALTPNDRVLNIMPLFHIHGLVAALLAPLISGGSVICTPGFDGTNFFSWVDQGKPTWYTAVPTMHQIILYRAATEADSRNADHLRFVRSSSAPLPPTLLASLEQTFHVPVIEAYGMTEAAHQMASNPLPPQMRKPGSVGIAAGPEVAIMGEEDAVLLPAGAIGEVVVRGANVTAGYLNDAAANAKAFVNGWFRTGDQGYLDKDGYLFLTGRLKELINRGGEKIAPREVDELLLTHPAVAQAVTFAMPDEKLGEEVAAAVVLRDKRVTEGELRQFVASHLADFKTPRRVLLLDEIPKSATGKVQRIGLAEKLGLTTGERSTPTVHRPLIQPRNQTERLLVNLWCEILKIPSVSVAQPFLEAGGDSLSATQLVANIEQIFAIPLSVVDLFDAPTIADQATFIKSRIRKPLVDANDRQLLRLIKGSDASRAPLFFAPGGGGSEIEFLIYARLLHLLGADQPIYGFFARGHDGVQPPHPTIAEMVTDYCEALRQVQPQGPYFLAGECIGGKVAFELARQLRAQGEEVALLLLLNTRFSDVYTQLGGNTLFRHRLRYHLAALGTRSFSQQAHYLWQRWQASPFHPMFFLQRSRRLAYRIRQAHAHYNHILRSYTPSEAYTGAMTLLVSADYYQSTPTMGSTGLATGGIEIYPLPGDLYSYLGQHVQTTAREVVRCLAEAQHKIG